MLIQIEITPPKPQEKSGSGSDTDPMNAEELKSLASRAKVSDEDTDPMNADELISIRGKSTQPKQDSGSDTDQLNTTELKNIKTYKKGSDTEPLTDEDQLKIIKDLKSPKRKKTLSFSTEQRTSQTSHNIITSPPEEIKDTTKKSSFSGNEINAEEKDSSSSFIVDG